MTNRDGRWKHAVAAVTVMALGATAWAAPVGADHTPPSATDANPCDDFVIVGSDGRATDRHQTVVQQHVTPAICELEQRVIADIAAERGLTLTLAVRDEILAYGRDEVRARLLIELTRLAGVAPGDRDAVEQGAVDWLTARYRQFRGDMARASSEEYATWSDDPCAYTPPGDFTYDPPAADCGGLVSLFSGGPRPPAYEEFVNYGLERVSGDGLDAAFGPDYVAALLSLIASLGAASAVGAAAAIPIAHLSVAAAIFPYAFRVEGLSGFVAVGPAAAVFAIVVVAVVVSIIRGTQILSDSAIPGRLAVDETNAALLAEQNLVDALESETAVYEVMLAYLFATSPDHPAPPASAVPPNAPDLAAPDFVTTTERGATVTTEPTFELLGVDEVLYEVWVRDRWFVVRPADGSAPPQLQPSLTYWEPSGDPVTVRFRDDELVVVRHGADGELDCGAVESACVVTDTLSYLIDRSAGTTGTSTYVGAGPEIISGPTIDGDRIEGSTITMSAEAVDPEGEPVEYRWTITRGTLNGSEVTQTYTGQTVTHLLLGNGTYDITLVVVDPAGGRTVATTDIEVAAVAAVYSVRTLHRWNGIDYREQPLVEQTSGRFEVTATAADVVSVDWDRNGVMDVTATADGSGVVTFVTPWFEQGVHAVDVAVSDGVVSEQYTFPIDVINEPPVNLRVEVYHPDDGWQIRTKTPDPAAPRSGRPVFHEGDVVRIRMQAADIGGDPIDYRGIWRTGRLTGTGNAEYSWLTLPEQNAGWVESAIVFDDQVAENVDDLPSVLVIASDGESPARLLSTDSNLAYFHVDNLPPVIGDVIVDADDQGRVDLDVVVSDPGSAARDVERVEIDWGDGSPVEDAVLTRDLDGVYLIDDIVGHGSHTYAAPGPYTVAITAHDDVTSVTSTTPVDVPAFAPVVDTVVDLVTAPEGSPATVAVAVSDVDTAQTDLTVTFQWGDGSTSVATYDIASASFVGTHTYAESGRYPVVVVASDGVRDSEPFEGHLVVGDVAPTVTLEQAAGQPDPTSGDAAFDVVFSEPVTGFDASDVVLGGTSDPTDVVVTAAGDGTTYLVTVSGMTRTGSVVASVAAGAATNVNETPSMASASTDDRVDFVAPLVLTVPTDRIVADSEPGRAGAHVEFSTTLTGGVGTESVLCSPASGSFFPIGTTTVTCVVIEPLSTALVEALGTPEASFVVEVRDAESPVIETATDPAPTSSADGSPTVVVYDVPTATDNSGEVDVTCVPASGSLFEVGETTVTCSAVDGDGNVTTSTFVVVVTGPTAGPGTVPTTTATTPPTTVAPRLPATGSSPAGALRIALVLLALGLAAAAAARRRTVVSR